MFDNDNSTRYEDINLNWAARSFVIQESENEPNYVEYFVNGRDVDNARLIICKTKGNVSEGTFNYAVKVNGVVEFSLQGIWYGSSGVAVLPLPGLKIGDVVRFEVYCNPQEHESDESNATPKSVLTVSLEYTALSICDHKYPEGSAICSKCGYVKAHDHHFDDGVCTLCGEIETQGYVGADADHKNIVWKLDKKNHIVTFTGTGDMEAYYSERNSWRKFKDDITKVVIGEGITSIGDGDDANSYFSYMDKLTEITFPSTMKSVGNHAFKHSGLEELVVPAKITKIGDYSFSTTNIQTVTFEGAPTIGEYAFEECGQLKDFYLMNGNQISSVENIFTSTPIGSATLHVNKKLYHWVKNSLPWKEFGTILSLVNNVEYTDAEGAKHAFYLPPEAPDNIWTLTDGAYKGLAISEDIPMQSLTYTRNFSAAGTWQPLYVPFEMQYSDWADKFDVAAINNFHEYSNENGETTKVELEVRYVRGGSIRANTPYLIRSKAVGEQSIVLNNATLMATADRSIDCSSTERKYTFTGTYESINGLLTKNYIYLSNGRLSKASNDSQTLKPLRWYLKIEDRGSMTFDTPAALSKPIDVIVTGDIYDDLTGLEEMTVIVTPADATATDIYTLNGIKLDKPQPGINIINGKAVYVK